MYLNFWSINDIVITLANTNSDNNTVQTNKIILSNNILNTCILPNVIIKFHVARIRFSYVKYN